VLHAGTRREADGRIVTCGGRVLAVTGLGPDLAAARECAYEAVAKISIDGGHHVRTDIAQHAASL
jgi:phosphoribosylamine--glycine ligase